jgi:hypothetical protein
LNLDGTDERAVDLGVLRIRVRRTRIEQQRLDRLDAELDLDTFGTSLAEIGENSDPQTGSATACWTSFQSIR